MVHSFKKSGPTLNKDYIGKTGLTLKMSYVEKWVTLGKVCHTRKKGHCWKTELHLKNMLHLVKLAKKNRPHLKK